VHGILFGLFLGALEPYLVLYLTFLEAHLATRMSALNLIVVSLILNTAVSIAVAVLAAFFYRLWSLWRKKIPTGRGTVAACWAAFTVLFLVLLFSGYLNSQFLTERRTGLNLALNGLFVLAAIAFAVVLQHWFVRRRVSLLRWGGGLAVASLAVSLGLTSILFGPEAKPFRGQSWRKMDPSLARAPNIIVIMLDTLRADHLSVHGYERPTSPELERIAREGVLFENAFTHSNWTPPSTTTLLTSLYESVHGVDQVDSIVPDSITTLAEALGQSGYTSAFLSANNLVQRPTNYTQGFDYIYHIFSDGYQAVNGRNRLPPLQLYAWRVAEGLIPGFRIPLDTPPNVFFEHLFNEVGVDKRNGAEVEGRWPSITIKPKAGEARGGKADWIYKHVRAYLSYMTSQPGYDAQQNKFFLYLHYFDPHSPYRAPRHYKRLYDPEFKGHYVKDPNGKQVCEYVEGPLAQSECFVESPPGKGLPVLSERNQHNLVAQYDGEITFLDLYLGKLVDFLKEEDLFDDTLIVFTSDHGEAFWEHEYYAHGVDVFQEEVHIPLIVTWPKGLPGGIRKPDPVGLVDIMPTLLDAAGLPPVPGMQGRSFLNVLRGEGQRRELYGETGYDPPRLFLIQDRFKLIYHLRDSLHKTLPPHPVKQFLFDLRADPGEQSNLLSNHAETIGIKTVESLQTELERRRAVVQEALGIHEPKEAELPKEVEERLKALGYLE
jgi:arylsulfatase A-like enzyme